MTLTIPAPATIAQRFAAWLAQNPVLADDGSEVTLDANAPGSLEQVLAGVTALEMAGVYRYVRDWCLELMVTTATEAGLLSQHAIQWDTPRIPAQAAVGNVQMTLPPTAASVLVPINQALTVDGSINWLVTAETTVVSGATTTVPVRASATGAGGNLAAGTSLTAVTPIAGVTAIVVDSSGIAGGAAIEAVEAWRSRIIAAIRNPPGGGTASDYERWAQAAGAAYVNVIPQWLGAGTVGIVVAMAGRVAPTTSELAQIATYLTDRSRLVVRANIILLPVTIVTQNVTLSITPDTVENRADVQAALASYFNGLGIGDTIYHSQLEAAVASVTGVTSNLVTTPAANVSLAGNQMAALGTILWQASS
ncbi:MAG: baseplate J/gp47 family protein [Acetobacter sp.]|uniref:baseplate J/gp47 family protein n=1 Tax=Acetobacter sp. TaxID=440 RepID=UPI0039E8703A